LEQLLTILNPESLINYGGIFLMSAVVFAQTGLFFCFFLPSGALMFTAGVWAATGQLHESVFTVCIALSMAAFLGNVTGYWFGYKTGPLLYKRKDSSFFKQEHLLTANKFYQKYGGIALTAGLFFPIIRTFAPIVAGIVKVNFRRFILFTLIGSVLWILAFVLAGYLIGKIPFIKPYLTYVVIGIVITVTIPLVIRIVKEFKKGAKENAGGTLS